MGVWTAVSDWDHYNEQDRWEGNMQRIEEDADLAREQANPTTPPYTDARLIKAAPALLYAAKYALSEARRAGRWTEGSRCLQAAIAAAECDET